MKHKIQIHSKYYKNPELRYISNLIFDSWFGFQVDFFSSKNSNIEIKLNGSEESIFLNSSFFKILEKVEGKLTNLAVNKNSLKNLPNIRLPRMLEKKLGIKEIPVFFANDVSILENLNEKYFEETSQNKFETDFFSIDVLGTCFFFISRIEEKINKNRDIFDRFSGYDSISYETNVHNLPIVDLYTEVLWSYLKRQWPIIDKKQLKFEVKVSCDVDNPFLYEGSIVKLLKHAAGDVVYRHNPIQSIRSLASITSSLNYRFAVNIDPYSEAIVWIMKQNKRRGQHVQFNFIPLVTNPRKDGPENFLSRPVFQTIKNIVLQDHYVGIHPGFETYRSPEFMSNTMKQYQIMRGNIDHEIGAKSKNIINQGRQHYLRWDVGVTEKLYCDAGITTDSSLAFADTGGFRCGTCRPFLLYSPIIRQVTKVMEEPLIAMDVSYISPHYLGLDPNDAFNKLIEIKNWCRKMNGIFSFLWHNSSLQTNWQRDLYLSIIDG